MHVALIQKHTPLTAGSNSQLFCMMPLLHLGGQLLSLVSSCRFPYCRMLFFFQIEAEEVEKRDNSDHLWERRGSLPR